jgi:hypothetical protein
MHRITLFCLIFLSSFAAYAQEDQSTWMSNSFQTDFNGSRYLLFTEIQPRFKEDTSTFSQLIVRPFVGYKITSTWQLWLGYAWQGEYNSRDKFDLATNDIVQQAQWIDNISPEINLQYRFRQEQRFMADADLTHRMRHRFRVQYNIPDSQTYLVAFDELFLHLNSVNHGRLKNTVQSGINQNRAYVGIGYKITPKILVDTGYQLQYLNNFDREDLFNHVWLTNVFVNF